MNNFLLTVAGCILLIIGALFAIPPMIDWNQYRGLFEEEVSRFLGREVRVAGDVQLRILPVPYVGFENLTIADSPGIPGPFIRARQFTLWLAVPPLLKGELEARRIEITKPDVRLRFTPEGGGNWQTLAISGQRLPFLPSKVALQSVNITDGKIRVENARGDRITTFQRVHGELSAGALAGPYKFAGHVGGPDKADLDIRFSTAPPEADGSVRLKVLLRSQVSAANVVLDGALSRLDGLPRFAGSLRGRGTTKVLTVAQGAADARRRPYFDVKANIAGDGRGMRYRNLVVSFDTAGRPQRLDGSGTAVWSKAVQFRTQLRSHWLDLDTMLGVPEEASPLDALRRIASRKLGVRLGGRSIVSLHVAQANLAGASIGDLMIRLSQTDRHLIVDKIKAQLPGGTQLTGDGRIARAPASDALSFEGFVIAKGRNLKRFAAWAQLPLPDISGVASGPFDARGGIEIHDKRFVLTDFSYKSSRGDVRADVVSDWSSKPRLTVKASLNNLDLSDFGYDFLALETLSDAVGNGSDNTNHTASTVASPASPESSPGSGIAAARALLARWQGVPVDLRLRGQGLRHGDDQLEQVDLAVTRTLGATALTRLKFETQSGIKADLRGEVDRTDAANPFARLSGVIGVDRQEGLDEFARVIAKAGRFAPPDLGRRAMVPARLAIESRFALADGHPTTLTADGTVRGDRVRLGLRTNGPLSNWRQQILRLDAVVDGRDVGQTMRWAYAPRSGPAKTDADADTASRRHPVTLKFTARGRPATGLRTVMAVDSAPLGAILTAQARLRPVTNDAALASDRAPRTAMPFDWHGELSLNTANFADAAALVLPSVTRLAGRIPVTGRVGVRFTADGWQLSPHQLQMGSGKFDGVIGITISSDPATRPSITADVSIDRIAAADLLNPLLAVPKVTPASSASPSRPEGRAPTDQPTSNEPPTPAVFWSDRPFALREIAGTDGMIKLRIGTLALADGLTASNVGVDVVLGRDEMRLTRIDATIGGGRMSATAELKAAAAGVRASIDGTITDMDLAAFALLPALQGRLAGRATMTARLAGVALSPRALAAGISGEGRLTAKSLTLPAIHPQALSRLANRVVSGDVDPKDIDAGARELARDGVVELSEVVAPLAVRDGALRIGRLTADGPFANATNVTTLDILRFVIDSDWRIQPKLRAAAQTADPKALPAVQLVYVGPLADLAHIVPRVSAGGLQRELVVRRMESDVRRLEQLRRRDEARGREQRERSRDREDAAKRRALENARRTLEQGKTRAPADKRSALDPSRSDAGTPWTSTMTYAKRTKARPIGRSE